MKRLIFIILVVHAGIAAEARSCTFAGPLPPSQWADTEASTNAPFRTNGSAQEVVSIVLELSATEGNSVEVAFGCDADEDGTLELDETVCAIGWDCGRWILRAGLATPEGRVGEVFSAEPVTPNVVKNLEAKAFVRRGEALRIRFAENGVPLGFGLPTELPEWLLDARSDLVRLTVRGVDAPDERFRAQATVVGTVLKIR